MKKAYIILFIILVLALVGGSFYWYEYRPSQIRKECTEKVYNMEIFRGRPYVVTTQTRTYNQCLHEKGLAF